MKYFLRLYVSGRTNASLRAIRNLQAICADVLKEKYELEVIDVLEHPQLAEDEKILATPTLIRDLPPPLRKIIGDLSQRKGVLLGLDLVPRADSEREPS